MAKKAAVKKKAPKKAKVEHDRRLELFTPKQTLALQYFHDPESLTFGNLKGSAIRAGFTESYADNITALAPEWISGFIGEDSSKLAKVERNLHKFLDLQTAKPVFTPTGKQVFKDKDQKIPETEEDARMLEIQLKATTFVAERLNRKKYGKDDKVNIGFSFNIAPVRQRYEA